MPVQIYIPSKTNTGNRVSGRNTSNGPSVMHVKGRMAANRPAVRTRRSRITIPPLPKLEVARYVPKTQACPEETKKDEPANSTKKPTESLNPPSETKSSNSPSEADLLRIIPALGELKKNTDELEKIREDAMKILVDLCPAKAKQIFAVSTVATLRHIVADDAFARQYVTDAIAMLPEHETEPLTHVERLEILQHQRETLRETHRPNCDPRHTHEPSIPTEHLPHLLPAPPVPGELSKTQKCPNSPRPTRKSPPPPVRQRKTPSSKTMHNVRIETKKASTSQEDVIEEAPEPVRAPTILSSTDPGVLQRSRTWRNKQRQMKIEEEKFAQANEEDFKAMSIEERKRFLRWRTDHSASISESFKMLSEDTKSQANADGIDGETYRWKTGEIMEIDRFDVTRAQAKKNKEEADNKLFKSNTSVLVRGVMNPNDPPYYSEQLNRVSMGNGIAFIRRFHSDLKNRFGEYYLSTFLLSLVLVFLFCLSLYFSLFQRFKLPYDILANVIIYALVYAQANGHYMIPERLTDKLYFARMAFLIAHITHLVGQLLVPWYVYYPLRFLEFWYLTDPIIAACFVIHFAAFRGWGVFSLPLYFTFIVGVGNTVIVRRTEFLRGAYLNKLLRFGTTSEVHPYELELRSKLEEAKSKAEKATLPMFREGLRDPFLVGSIDDALLGVVDWDFKQDIRTPRFRDQIPFKEVHYKHPHFEQVLTEDGKTSGETMIVCREIVSEASRLSFLKFQDKCNGESSGSLLASMMSVMADINMPFHNTIYYNSVMHGFRLYLLTLQSRKTADQWLKLQSVVIGLSNGSFGKMRKRWFERNFDLPFDSSYYHRLASFVAMETGFVLMPFFGYIWRYVPDLLKEKKFTLNPPRLRLDFVGDFWRAITGYSILAYAQPTPDVSNADNLIAGVEARLNVGQGKTNVIVGQAKPAALRELRETVIEDINRWIPIQEIPTRDEWLDSVSTYSAAKKNMLRLLEDTGHYLDSMFIKWESYTGFKAPRIISNSDKRFLVVEGPIVKAMEEQLESLPSTLTGLPVSQWSTAVEQRIGIYEHNPNFRIYVSDVSSFESAITPSIKDATENLVFDQVLKLYPRLAQKLRQRQQTRHYEKNIRGTRIAYDYTGRASGDARTYCGNTIVNHYLLKNLYRHLSTSELPYFVSGDDAIFVMPSTIPANVIVDYYNSLGFDVKLKETAVHNSSFCGFNYDPMTYGRMADDPLSVIIKFFTTKDNLNCTHYKKYLQDQALCMLHEYPADPVLRKAVDWIVRNQPASHYKKRTWWQDLLMREGNQWRSLLLVPPTSFQTYAETHDEGRHSAAHYAALSELFYDVVRLTFDNHPMQARYKFQCAIEKLDVGTPRAYFNAMQKLDPYHHDEFCKDIDGFYNSDLYLLDFVACLADETELQ